MRREGLKQTPRESTERLMSGRRICRNWGWQLLWDNGAAMTNAACSSGVPLPWAGSGALPSRRVARRLPSCQRVTWLNSCFCHLLAAGQQSDVSGHKAEETFIISKCCSTSWHCWLWHCFHLGLSLRFLLVSPGWGSRRSRRLNVTLPAEAPLQHT